MFEIVRSGLDTGDKAAIARLVTALSHIVTY